MKRWMLLVFAAFGLTCLAQGLATAIPNEEVRIETDTTPDPYSVPECRPFPGATFKVQKISDTLVEFIASGLQPGETPYVYYNTPVGDIKEGKGGGLSGNRVGEDGTFYSDMDWTFWDTDRLIPPEGQASATWDIRLEHARGVECTTITLP